MVKSKIRKLENNERIIITDDRTYYQNAENTLEKDNNTKYPKTI